MNCLVKKHICYLPVAPEQASYEVFGKRHISYLPVAPKQASYEVFGKRHISYLPVTVVEEEMIFGQLLLCFFAHAGQWMI